MRRPVSLPPHPPRNPPPVPITFQHPNTPPAHAPRRARGTEAGFGLLEVALALLVIAIATLGSVSWTLSGMSLETANREEGEAHDALRQLCEELHALPFDEVFARCNTDATDDPDGPGTARGAVFTIEPTRVTGFLDRLAVPRDGAPRRRLLPLRVELEFPVNGMGEIVESAQGAGWSDRVWDLDGDGEIGTTPILVGSYRLLPVRIRILWTGSGGTRELEHVRLLSRRIRPESDV